MNVQVHPTSTPSAIERARAMPSEDSRREFSHSHGVFFGLIAALIWGGYLVATRFGISLGLSSADLAFIRYSVAGSLLFPWLMLHFRKTLGGRSFVRVVVLAILAGPAFVFVGASGFHFAPLAHSAVIQLGCVTLVGVLLSAAILREKPSARRMAGVLIIVSGLLITAGPGVFSSGSDVWKGDLLFAAAGTMWAVFTVLQRRWQIEALAATAGVSVLSGLMFSPIYLASRGLSNLLIIDIPTLLLLIAVLGVLSGVVALFAFGKAIESLGASRASVFPALAPSVAMLLGIPISNELPSVGQVAGLMVLSVGLLLALSAPCRAPLRDGIP